MFIAGLGSKHALQISWPDIWPPKVTMNSGVSRLDAWLVANQPPEAPSMHISPSPCCHTPQG